MAASGVQEDGAIPRLGRPRWRQDLDLAATIVMLVAGIVVLVLTARGYFSATRPAVVGVSPEMPLPEAPISVAGAPHLGSPTAGVALVEYSDFECPFCGKFAREVLPELKRRYVDTGQVVLFFRNDPLPKHRLARPAAEAAVCAGDQGQFWSAQEVLFGGQAQLGEVTAGLSAALHLIDTEYRACLTTTGKDRVNSDSASAKALHIRVTPTLLIGLVQGVGVRVYRALGGARPIGQFDQAIDDQIADANRQAR